MSFSPFKPLAPITLLANDKVAVNTILDSVIQGEIDAMNRHELGDVTNKRGMVAYCERDTYLHRQFRDLGWHPTEVNNQRRILSPVGRYPYQIQLLHTRGWVVGNRVRVSPKGMKTRFCVNVNADWRNRQLTMSFDGMEHQKGQEEIRSLWIISRVYKNILSIYVGEATYLNEMGTEMHCIEYFSMPPYELTEMTSDRTDLPQGVDIVFPDIEMDEENGNENE